MTPLSRRALLTAGVAAAGGSVVAAAATLGRHLGLVPPDAGGFYGHGETLTSAAHRLIGRHAMAREFPRHMISARPFANSVGRRDEAFLQHQAAGFTTWRLAVDGLIAPRVAHVAGTARHAGEPADQRAQLRGGLVVHRRVDWDAARRRARHGVGELESAVRGVRVPRRQRLGQHRPGRGAAPQTLVAWGMNGGQLRVPFGGPLRMRVPRQLGYKSTKYINRLVVTDSLDDFATGKGSADAEAGYSWYAGI